jgi:NAD(P)-dependent dehydrogenase (short-subunit alcohol dehydrogenase family)
VTHQNDTHPPGRNPAPQTWRMDQRTVLVTGASSGIGRATASALVGAGALVLAHARDHARATTLAAQLEANGGRVVPVSGDLGSLQGVRALAHQVRRIASSEGVHVVVNNAGAAFSRRRVSPDGVERTLAVNHLAVAALISMLLDALRVGADASGRPSRVVNLSSTLEKRGNRDLEDWSYPDRFSQVQAYSDSKLVNLAYTYALARDLSEHGVNVNAADPGNVATAFGRNAGGILKGVQLAGRPFMASPEKGARTSVRLASDPSLDGVSGVYFRAGRPGQSSAASRDPTFGDRVYGRTAALLNQHQRPRDHHLAARHNTGESHA